MLEAADITHFTCVVKKNNNNNNTTQHHYWCMQKKGERNKRKSHKKFNIERLCSVAVFCFVHDPTVKKIKQQGRMEKWETGDM